MKNKVFYPLLAFVVLILSVGMACSLFSGGGSTPTQPPAQQLPSQEQQPPTQAQEPPAQQPPSNASAPFELDSNLYTHSSGAFSFYPPAGWSVDESENGDVLMVSPDEVGAIYVTVTNTGHALDSQGFGAFAQAVEDNFFGDRDQFKLIDSQTDPSVDLVFKKTFLYDNIPQEVVSYYHQAGQAIYTIDYWADQAASQEYFDAYQNIEISFDPSVVSSLPLYNFVYTFTGPKELFTIEVPTSFEYTLSTDTNLMVDSFKAPDGHALIESIMYDDGSPYPKAEAGKATLRLLNQFYTDGAGDIKISDDAIMEDGSERLTWTSKKNGYSGVTFFEVRSNTTLLIFSVLYDDPYVDTYKPVLDYTVSSYTQQ